jgi:hypothetical protein
MPFGFEMDNSRVTLQIVASLTDNSIGFIYNYIVFIVLATVNKCYIMLISPLL